jgi:rare lipoprotein A (peptidoglycan hydrolase)
LQTNLNLPTPTRRRRGAFIAIAILLSAVGTGSILGITASADSPAVQTEPASTVAEVDIDSLYAAKVADDPHSDTSYLEVVTPERTLSGRVSWYGPGFHGRKTANGERFDSGDLTAAHKTLPFGSLVRVVDERTGKAVLVRINDRGPYSGGRILDLSEGAARRLGITGRGTCTARLELYSSGSRTAEPTIPTTFDGEARAVAPHGFTVKLLETGNYSQASALVRKLRENGDEKIFLSQIRKGSTMSYQVTLGLFSSELACRNLLEELSQDFSAATMIRFDRGMPHSIDVAARSGAESGL